MAEQNAYFPTMFVSHKGVTFGRATKAYNEIMKMPFGGQEIRKIYEGMPLFDGNPEHLGAYVDLIMQEMGLEGILQLFGGGRGVSPQGRYEGGTYDLPVGNFFGNDVGTNGETQWPVAMGFAHSWNKELIRKAAETYGEDIRGQHPANTVNGTRSSAAYCAITDIRYNPLSGRFDEGFGEDPHMVSEMAYIWADSMTGRKSKDDLYYQVIPQTKHWTSYNTEFFRSQNICNISVRSFYEHNAKTGILPFRTGAFLGFMSSYGCINGIPSTASFAQKFAQKQAPQGLMTACDAGSDTGYIEKTASTSGFSNGYDATYSHDYEDKSASMLLAGHVPGGGGFGQQVDMASVLKKALVNGVLGLKEENLLRQACPYVYAAVRIGAMDERDKNGLPKYYPFVDYAQGGSKHTNHTSALHQKVALQASHESIVLTKNDGTLPLTKGGKTAVFGSFADTVQYGLYTSKILEPDGYNGQVATAGISAVEALREKLGADNVVFENGNEVFAMVYGGKYLTAREDGTLYFADDKMDGSLFEMADWGQNCVSIYSPFCKKWLRSGAGNAMPPMGPPPAPSKDDSKKEKRPGFVPGPDALFGNSDDDDDDKPAPFVPGPDVLMGGSKGPNCNKDLTVYASGDAVFRPNTKGSFLVDFQFPEFLERKLIGDGFALKCGSKFNTVDFGTRSATPVLMGWYLQEKDGKLMIDADPASAASKAPDVEKSGFDGHYVFDESVETPYGGAAVKTVEDTDYAIVVLGMPYNGICGEGTDRLYLDMAAGQVAMTHRVAETYAKAGKKTVVVVKMDAPAAVQSLQDDPNISAIITMPVSGQYEAVALADILFGDATPTGRLNATWYTDNGALPAITKYSLPYNAKVSLPGSRKGQIVSMDEVSTLVDPTATDLQQWKLTYMYYENTEKVTYPFGYGLSYSTFTFSNLKIPASAKAGESFEVSVTVKNTGKVDTADVVQLYLSKQNPAYGTYAPKKVLGAFEKVFLKAGEEKTVTLTVKPDVITVWDVNSGSYLVEGGTYDLFAAESSDLTGPNTLSAVLILDGPGIGSLDVSKRLNLWKRSYGSHDVGYREYSKARTAEALHGSEEQWDETFAVMSMSDKAWVVLKNVPLNGLKTAIWSVGSEEKSNTFELRIDSPDGAMFGSAQFGKTGEISYKRYVANQDFDAGTVHELGYTDVAMQLTPSSGTHDLYVVFLNPDMRLAEVSFVK